MIVRIWHGKIKKEALEKFHDVVNNHDIPILISQQGCLQALYGREKKGDRDYAILSIWEDLDSLKKFTGPNWQDPVPGASEEKMLEGQPRVEHFLMTPYQNF
jgi:heme-degrading monooxygenase HmoA